MKYNKFYAFLQFFTILGLCYCHQYGNGYYGRENAVPLAKLFPNFQQAVQNHHMRRQGQQYSLRDAMVHNFGPNRSLRQFRKAARLPTPRSRNHPFDSIPMGQILGNPSADSSSNGQPLMFNAPVQRQGIQWAQSSPQRNIGEFAGGRAFNRFKPTNNNGQNTPFLRTLPNGLRQRLMNGMTADRTGMMQVPINPAQMPQMQNAGQPFVPSSNIVPNFGGMQQNASNNTVASRLPNFPVNKFSDQTNFGNAGQRQGQLQGQAAISGQRQYYPMLQPRVPATNGMPQMRLMPQPNSGIPPYSFPQQPPENTAAPLFQEITTKSPFFAPNFMQTATNESIPSMNQMMANMQQRFYTSAGMPDFSKPPNFFNGTYPSAAPPQSPAAIASQFWQRQPANQQQGQQPNVFANIMNNQPPTPPAPSPPFGNIQPSGNMQPWQQMQQPTANDTLAQYLQRMQYQGRFPGPSKGKEEATQSSYFNPWSGQTSQQAIPPYFKPIYNPSQNRQGLLIPRPQAGPQFVVPSFQPPIVMPSKPASTTPEPATPAPTTKAPETTTQAALTTKEAPAEDADLTKDDDAAPPSQEPSAQFQPLEGATFPIMNPGGYYPNAPPPHFQGPGPAYGGQKYQQMPVIPASYKNRIPPEFRYLQPINQPPPFQQQPNFMQISTMQPAPMITNPPMPQPTPMGNLPMMPFSYNLPFPRSGNQGGSQLYQNPPAFSNMNLQSSVNQTVPIFKPNQMPAFSTYNPQTQTAAKLVPVGEWYPPLNSIVTNR